MYDDFLVNILSPSETVLETSAYTVTLPGKEGVFSVLAGHSKLIANLNIGIISVSEKKGEGKYFVSGGIAQVEGGELNIVSEFAVNLTDFDQIKVAGYIEGLENELRTVEQDSLQAEIIRDKLEKYKSLRQFL